MSDATSNLDFQVRRDDWANTRFEASPEVALQDGQVRFAVDRFALTSNNITYAAAGDMLDYWGFFPAGDGWGRIPAMGFADVVESRHDDVRVGERFFGFLPMSTHLVVEVTESNAGGFTDGIEHRRNHAPVYRQYQRTESDALYDAAFEDRLLVLRGLFMTSFLVDGFLTDNDAFGARRCIIGSASSKTAIALAWLLSRAGAVRVIGVTSPRNREFVEGLGFYDEVVCYEDVKTLRADEPVAFVDCSGDGDFINALHQHFGTNLKHHCVVGATHWDSGPRSTDLPGPEPTFFFAPGEIKNRIEAWGADGFARRLADAWRAFCSDSENWMQIQRGAGRGDLQRVYAEMLAGNASPDVGHVLSLKD
jgi:hypothetical protein